MMAKRRETTKVFKPNWDNRTLFHGENLDFLRAMNTNSVDLIATDPPFNKGKDFHATPDSLAAGAKFQDRWSWENDIHQEWVDQIGGENEELMEAIESARSAHSESMGAYMCFMAVRLIEMHRILKPTGSIYLHCDPTASHYLKATMDAIFGWKQFRNEIVWCYRGGGVPAGTFAKKHDLIFWYSKGKNPTFNVDEVRIPYSEESAARLQYKARAFRGERTYDNYEQNPKGKHPEDWWVMQAIMPSSKERVGYPTQKPLALYERIIKASSNKGDMILDPFCGCATTLVVAEKNERKWVGIDLWKGARDLVVKRMKDESHGLFKDGGKVVYSTEIPKRKDGIKVSSYRLPPQERGLLEPWQRLTKAQIVDELADAQKYGKKVICPGCGRKLEVEFMQLDHLKPKVERGEDDISNRILLCGPCNRTKGAYLTLGGLINANRKSEWMDDEDEADRAKHLADKRYRDLKHGMKKPLSDI